ncbi:MAG: rod shape-determining protein MreC [Verrucomicrobia bacterium]|jgi:rod shape-determining protein MreC|nr:rod shape-determining protein MreC [Verrucomicrobiota bacterium]
MFKKKHFVGITVTVLVSLVLLALPTRLSLQVRSALSNMFLPLFGLATATRTAGEAAALKLTPRSRLESENLRLNRENSELKLKLANAEELLHENTRLRQQLGWKASAPWKLKLGRVVLRDPANWWRAVQVDLGSRDGVKLNATVLTPQGLVGRVSAVGFDHSQVVLLGDPSCSVSALVGNEERNTGVIGASSTLDGSLVEMSYLPRHAEIAAGTPVRTSGLGGMFPKGILVGHVVDTRPEEYGLYLAARVRLSANLSGLEELWVIVP